MAISSICALLLALSLLDNNVTAQGDITPPSLADLQLDPVHVDTGEADQTILVTARFIDDLSGFESAFIIFQPSIGTTQSRSVQFSYRSLAEGTLLDGVYTDTLELPQYSAEGRWVLTEIAMVDQVGNRYQVLDRDEDGLDEYKDYFFVNGPSTITFTSTLYLPLVNNRY